MGYNTSFEGGFDIDKPMTKEFVRFINRFSSTRRMKRDNEKIKEIYPDWKELCFKGNLGSEGEYFAPVSRNFGQETEKSIIEYNNPPETQPGLWCQWIIKTNEKISDDISEYTGLIEHDGGEKFYDYVEWLDYMINNFFIPENLTINGAVLAVGESYDDATYIIVDRNQVETYNAMDEKNIDKIITKYNDNKTVLDYFKKVETTPDNITSTYWSWYDDEEN